MSYRLYIIVALLLAAAAVAGAQIPPPFKGPDNSLRGGEYAVLNNLLLRDGRDKLVYAGRERVMVYGKQYEAAKFVVDTGVYVSVSGFAECLYDHVAFQPCKTTKWAEIEVYVGLDEAGEIHDTMLQRIHAYWSAHKPKAGKKVDAEEHLNYKDGEYMMFQVLRGERWLKTRAQRLVWVDGKFIKFQFKRFTLGDTYSDVVDIPLDKDEGLESFFGMGTYVRPRALKIQPQRMKGAFRAEFFRLYESGAFARDAQPKFNNGL